MPTCVRCHARLAVGIGMLIAMPAGHALAQTTRPVEAFVSLNAGLMQPATGTLTRTTVFTDALDRDELKTETGVKSGPGFDVGGGALFGGRFFVGIATSRYSDSQPGTLTVTASHPLFHPTLTATGTTDALERSESRVDLQFGYNLPVTRRFNVLLFGGPSRFTVSQETIVDFALSERFDTASRTWRLVGPSDFEIAKEKASGWGYNVGADASYMLTRTVGVGGLVRYSRATLDLGDPIESVIEDRTVTKPFDAGGLQVSGGVRFRF